MIVQSNTITGKSKACNGIKETCCESAKTAVAKRGFWLNLLDAAKFLSFLLQCCIQLLIDAKVDQIA